jgi:hypothetical protein
MNELSGRGRAQKTGRLIIAFVAIEMVLFLYGALRRSYLALALPMTAAMTALTALGFWVGWTMMSLEDEPEEPPVTTAE